MSTHNEIVNRLAEQMRARGFQEVQINEEPDIILTNKTLADEIIKIFTESRVRGFEPPLNIIAVQDNISQEIIKLIETRYCKPTYEISKLGFLVGGKLMVFRRVSNLRLEGDEYKFDTQIRKYKEWKTVPVRLVGKKVFEQGI